MLNKDMRKKEQDAKAAEMKSRRLAALEEEYESPGFKRPRIEIIATSGISVYHRHSVGNTEESQLGARARDFAQVDTRFREIANALPKAFMAVRRDKTLSTEGKRQKLVAARETAAAEINGILTRGSARRIIDAQIAAVGARASMESQMLTAEFDTDRTREIRTALASMREHDRALALGRDVDAETAHAVLAAPRVVSRVFVKSEEERERLTETWYRLQFSTDARALRELTKMRAAIVGAHRSMIEFLEEDSKAPSAADPGLLQVGMPGGFAPKRSTSSARERLGTGEQL